ncbi:MAG: sigma-54 dependent transcriptional regulator [bacterium]|nr:sigma-54 dependent transcriptional regulator [bacterium]
MDSQFLIYVVEDDEWYNRLLVHSLSLNPDYTVKGFHSAKEVLRELDNGPAVITVDYGLPDMKGDELLNKIKEADPSIEVIIISEQEKIETAVSLLKSGAYDYLVKSKDIKEMVLNTVNHICKNFDLRKELASLKKEVQQKYSFENSLIGNSPGMRKVYDLMNRALANNITVSISGETGTGKEMVAKAIHFNSNRKDKPFIAVNVAAIPSELIESELFGFEKGAFTGAISRRKGKFEEANGGTLFLDEIGEMDLNAQVKLLRVLQEKEVTRIGSNTPVPVNCRIIVATHRNLLEEVKKGNFREDLYYRLYGLPISLPPLRDRQDDVLILANHFMVQFCKENGLEEKRFSKEARHKILSYQWPGNVRELKSIVELAVVMTNELEIGEDDLTFSTGSDLLPDLLTKEQTLREYSIRIVNFYMGQCNNDTALVAEKLGIGQTTVYRMLKEMKTQVS